MRRLAVAVALFAASALHAQDLARMSLEEKVGQLLQYTTDLKEWPEAASKGLVGAVLNTGNAAGANALQRMVMAGSRQHIPLLVGYDVIHGYRTIFPIPLGIAATWDPESAERAARIAATEARAEGVVWTFAPMVDIARDPRWGRIAEGAGEDPLLGSAMAAAYVRGFQGNGGPDTILACAKHFAAYGAAEGGRDYDAAEMSERRLREVYLPPFKAAVDAGVASLMSAFASVNGVPATANGHLLTDILRNEWKFNGFVVSDWASIDELRKHGVAADERDAALKAITAGVDLDMVDRDYATLVDSVRKGLIPESVIDTAVRRVIRAKEKAGVLKNPFTDESRAAAVTLTPESRAAARRIAARSLVLLRNEGDLLPLKSGSRVAVVGPLADSKADMLGPWAAQGKPEDVVTVVEAFRRRLGDRLAAQDAADVIVAVFGEEREMSGEAASRASLDLPGDQEKQLEALVAAGKPVVLVVMSGRPLTIAWAAEHVPAILEAWFPGIEAGNAIADVLLGDVNPSGKLPVTFPRSVGQVPIYYAHMPTGRPPDPANKYTSKYLDVSTTPLYPFGFGLSYTKFDYAALQLSAPSMTADGSLTVSANVRNSGGRAGEEIVQLYVRDPVASVSRPVKELKAFRRIALNPGETKRVAFTITRADLQFWGGKGWVVEPGEFVVWIGPDCERGVEGRFEVK